jgi:hypothetical protein
MIRTVLRAPIHFVAEAGLPTHAPVVLATIGAIHTRLIVDTGSDVHLLTRELAEAAGLALTSVDQGTDHAGSSMDSWVVGDAPVEFDEAADAAPLILHDVVAIPAPAAFTERGIGGAISPQRLHATAFAVIDQVDDELLLLDEPSAAVRAALLERHPGPGVLELSRRAGYDIPLVDAAIDPYPAVPVLINTGGKHTEFEPGAVPGLAAGELTRIGTGVSGAAVMGGSAGPGVLRLGAVRIAVANVMLRSGMDDPPAMIGQDVLRGTVIAVGPDQSTSVLWQVATLESAVPDEAPGTSAEPSPTV